MSRALSFTLLIATVTPAAAHPVPAQPLPAPSAARAPLLNPQMSYDGYRDLIQEVRPYRLSRLIDWNSFAAAARRPNVLILDARSERQFAAGHIEGAVNVPLTEFSDELLAEIIGPDRNRPILIYCNNNFREDRPPVALKSGRLALNLSTFTHLYGYGYRNIRELNDVVRWTIRASAG